MLTTVGQQKNRRKRNQMKRTIAIILLSLASGCVNLLSSRNPFSDCKVEQVYQSTRMAAGASVFVAYPQMMSTTGGNGFEFVNIFTIPLGLLVFCDAVCEFPVDTVCLPFDILISSARDRR